jgi:GNAT superfamily N-acetyltransferase
MKRSAHSEPATAQPVEPGRVIEHIGRDRSDDAVRVLAAAFHEYPVMRFVLNDAGEQYDRRLHALIRYFCERRLTQDWPLLGCFVCPSVAKRDVTEAERELVAVAGINDPGPFVDNEAHDREWAALRAAIGPSAVERLEYYEQESDGDAPPGAYHFLGIIGVRPDQQGKGHARALIEHIMERCRADKSSAGVWLSTETADNVPLYEHLGFRLRAERDIGALRYRVMVWTRA